MADTDTRQKILDVAEDLFCRRGYAAVGTQEICTAAGVLKGTLYHYFPTKLDIALDVLRAFGARVAGVYAKAAGGPGPPAARLARVFALAKKSAEGDVAGGGAVAGCLHGVLAAELAATEPKVRDLLEDVNNQWAAALAPITDDTTTARGILAYLAGVEMAAKAANDPAVVTRLAKLAARLLAEP